MAVLLEGLFSTLFVRPRICDTKWATLTHVFSAHSIHCFWRVC